MMAELSVSTGQEHDPVVLDQDPVVIALDDDIGKYFRSEPIVMTYIYLLECRHVRRCDIRF